LYRENFNVASYIKFYYALVFSAKKTTQSEKEGQKLEMEILEYHSRSMATPSGINELEKQLQNHIS
jgi:hypothetical protein